MEYVLVLLVIVAVVILAARTLLQTGRHKSGNVETPIVVTPPPQPFDAATSTPQAPPSTLRGAAYVIDGDTITIQKTQIRLFGIDAPELDHPCGRNARSALISLCKGQVVHAEILAKDDHGRTVARCCLQDGRDLSAEMVQLGLALDWAKFSGGKYRSLEMPDARKKLWLADARQKGRMHVWEQFEARRAGAAAKGNQPHS